MHCTANVAHLCRLQGFARILLLQGEVEGAVGGGDLRRWDSRAAREKQAKTALVPMKAAASRPGCVASTRLMRGPRVAPWKKALPPNNAYLQVWH